MLKDKEFIIKCRHSGRDINTKVKFYNYINDFPVFASDEDTNCYLVRSTRYGSIIIVSKDILTYLDANITNAIVTNLVYNKIYSSEIYDIKNKFIADLATAKECGLLPTKAALLVIRESFKLDDKTKTDLDKRLNRLNESKIDEYTEKTHVIDLSIINSKLEFKS